MYNLVSVHNELFNTYDIDFANCSMSIQKKGDDLKQYAIARPTAKEGKDL